MGGVKLKDWITDVVNIASVLLLIIIAITTVLNAILIYDIKNNQAVLAAESLIIEAMNRRDIQEVNRLEGIKAALKEEGAE
jgi:hypothetical protein